MRSRPPSVHARLLVLLVLGLTASVLANVEKTIFLGPPAVPESITHLLPPHLLQSLPSLTPDGVSSWRTQLSAAFPWIDPVDFVSQSTTWVLLDRLSPGQRYEVRVCWPATQPTAFTLDTWDIQAALAGPLSDADLSPPSVDSSLRPDSASTSTSALLLRVVAAADYVAANRSLMDPANVPLVSVDLILDPFLLNVLPRSLVPAVACILAVAAISAVLARNIVPWLRHVASSPADPSPSARHASRKKTKQT